MIDLLGMQRAVWRSARTTTEKIVLLAIADFYSDRWPEPWPSVPTLAERCSLGRTAVLEAIAALERDGVLVVRLSVLLGVGEEDRFAVDDGREEVALLAGLAAGGFCSFQAAQAQKWRRSRSRNHC